MKILLLKSISFLLIICSFFLSSCNKHNKLNTKIEDDIMANVRKDGWLFKTDMGCDQLSKFTSEWNVNGIWISKDSLIEIYIRKSYEYKNNSSHNNRMDFQILKKVFPEKFKQISKVIKDRGYDKFGLLFYEGRYNCNDGVNYQKDTIPILFGNNYTIKEYVELGGISGKSFAGRGEKFQLSVE